MKPGNKNIINGVILLLSLFTFLFLSSCTETIEKNTITAPKVTNIQSIPNTVELPDEAKFQMNGIYSSSNEEVILGSSPILRWNGTILNIFTNNNYTFFALKGGIRNDSLIFAGNSSDGKMRIALIAELPTYTNLAELLSAGNIKFSCRELSSNGKKSDQIKLTFKKKLINDLDKYLIITHDGGGGEQGYSPNSTGGIKFSALTGANGMELDVNLSKDNVPIIFHDAEFNAGNINSDFCVGPVTNYTLDDLKILAVLPDGSKIPTLEEALNLLLTQSNISTVWLDIKNVNSIDPSLDLISKYKAKAALLNKPFDIFIGLPTEAAVSEYLATVPSEKPKVLTELSPSIVKEINADAWGPQWDPVNNSPDQIAAVHAMGKKVFCWTIDDPSFFKQLTGVNKPDGIITNLPQKMIYEYLIQNN